MPYTKDVLIGLSAFCLEGSAIWRSRTSLICFHIVELHLPDRVLHQFGLLQHIPEVVEVIQRITSQGRSGEDWAAFHAPYIQRWADRLKHIAEQSPFVDPDPIRASFVYMQWYWEITRRWISRLVQRPPLTFLPRGNVERRLVYAMQHAVSNIGHLMDDPPEPTRLMDALAHVRWDLESVLESLPTLPLTGHSDVSSPIFGAYGDIPSTSTPAYDFGDIPSTSMPAYDFGDIPSTSIPAYDFPSTSVPIHPSDVPSASIPPFDIPSTSEVRRDDVVYQRRRRRQGHIETQEEYYHQLLSKGWSRLSRASPSSILIRCMSLSPCSLRWSMTYIFEDGVEDAVVDADVDVAGDKGESIGGGWRALDVFLSFLRFLCIFDISDLSTLIFYTII
ncbi:uncharacterized protein LOC109710700 [Ananas comosus]|uniref:Uncharacterized protein LOC109710700 n=1 Tax=Ananas comosus TaxID=4615 RepID=A0A6P5F6Z7_ANACO|nr:uncharacterized protein LOC109710700 [Ananas comosus]